MNKENCKYCDDNNDVYLHDDCKYSLKADCETGIVAYVFQNKLYINSCADTHEPSYMEADVEINYCPMCGRKLVIENE